MADNDPKAVEALRQFARMKTERSAYERAWQDIRDLVRPGSSDFTRGVSPGSTRTDAIYDGTAPQALEDLASALQADLTNPSDRWFSIQVNNMGALQYDRDALDWLDQVSDVIYDEYANPSTNHQSSLHENYLDIGAFGTSVQYQEYAEGHLVFRAYPLADCFMAENSKGRVDLLHRCCIFETRQLFQEFDEARLPQKVKDDAVTNAKKWEVIHCVYPRGERNAYKLDRLNKRYASLYILKDGAITLDESGYDSFPYHCPRWEKLAGEIYGRGPAIKCLPDIKMLNRIEFTLIKQAQKAVDPPLTVPNDGFLLPIKTAPGSINFKEPNSEPIEVLEMKGNIAFGEEKAEQKREAIKKAFYTDWAKLKIKNERQTAYEIAEQREEQLKMLAPMLGRLASELLNPGIARSFELLRNAGKIPDPPGSLAKQQLKVTYISAAARAQKATKAISIGRYIQEIVPLAQVKPDIFDAVDFDFAAQELGRTREIPAKLIRSPDEIAAIREQRAQQQQQQQLAEAAEPVSKAVLNLAQANEKGGFPEAA